MSRAIGYLLVFAVLTFGSACGDENVEIFVDVQTDLVPGTDFDQVSTELLSDEARPPERSSRISAGPADDFVAGHRVAEFADLAKGTYTLRVTLTLADAPVVSERLLIQLVSDRAVTVEIDGACAGVVCPGPGDPAGATECVAGACVAASLDAGADTGVDAGTDTGVDAGELMILAPTSPINVNVSARLGATGGVAPYSFSLVSGEGAVDAEGVLMTPNYGGEMRVRVTDSVDGTAEVTVSVGGTGLFAVGGYYGMVSDLVRETTDGSAWTSHMLPLTRGEVVSVVFEDALYILGGYESGTGNVDAVIRSQDGTADSWRAAGLLPAPRGWGGAVVHDGRIIYAGGRDGDVRENTDVFASADGATWAKIGDLPEPSTWGGLATFQGKLFYLGGKRVDGASDAIWTSTDGSSWTVETETLPGRRAGGSIVVFQGRLWYIGGLDEPPAGRKQVWSSADGLVWTDAGFDFPVTTYNAGATVHDGRIWIVGGNSGTYSASVYSSADGLLWTQAEDMPQAADRVGALSFTPTPATP
ncbi:MAG: hypothetical protein DRJ42_12705 [Deltaproteobacteria bacterium]|nr:MAG: hypothetical protein DRJ42_12705 [Deltaproteobacteria bacterium]